MPVSLHPMTTTAAAARRIYSSFHPRALSSILVCWCILSEQPIRIRVKLNALIILGFHIADRRPAAKLQPLRFSLVDSAAGWRPRASSILFYKSWSSHVAIKSPKQRGKEYLLPTASNDSGRVRLSISRSSIWRHRLAKPHAPSSSICESNGNTKGKSECYDTVF